MKTLVLELQYEGFWKVIFGPNLNKVEIIEAIRCFKCDFTGFAIICGLELKAKDMVVQDLAGSGSISSVETRTKTRLNKPCQDLREKKTDTSKEIFLTNEQLCTNPFLENVVTSVYSFSA